MKGVYRQAVMAAACAVAAAGPAWASEQAAVDATAVEAATQWLGIVDAGDYGRSYDEASSVVRVALSKDRWTASLTGIRTPLGRLIARARTTATATTQLPGAPDGRYVVVTFSASLENKQAANETVTVAKDADGAWRVAGYFIN